MDVEGADLEVLAELRDWRGVQRLHVELSVDTMRQEQPDGSGYAVFENICQSLREGGFQLCLVDSLDIFDPAYWRAEHRRKGFDNNFFSGDPYHLRWRLSTQQRN